MVITSVVCYVLSFIVFIVCVKVLKETKLNIWLSVILLCWLAVSPLLFFFKYATTEIKCEKMIKCPIVPACPSCPVCPELKCTPAKVECQCF